MAREVKHRTVGGLLRTKKRWCKGNYFHAGRYCLEGAISCVHTHDRNVTRAKVFKALSKLFKGKYRADSIIGFNDDKNTTFSMVRKVIREAGI